MSNPYCVYSRQTTAIQLRALSSWEVESSAPLHCRHTPLTFCPCAPARQAQAAARPHGLALARTCSISLLRIYHESCYPAKSCVIRGPTPASSRPCPLPLSSTHRHERAHAHTHTHAHTQRCTRGMPGHRCSTPRDRSFQCR